MRRQRPQEPWPFSVAQDEFAHRLRVDGWMLLQVGYEHRTGLKDGVITRLSERYLVSRPTIYRWLNRMKQHRKVLPELDGLVSEAKALIDEMLRARLLTPDEFSSVRRVIDLQPVEAAKRYTQGDREFIRWLNQEAFEGP